MNEQTKRTIESLKHNRFDAVYFETGAEAKAYLLEQIGEQSASFGGSVTLDKIGIYDALKEKGFSISDDVNDMSALAKCAAKQVKHHG